MVRIYFEDKEEYVNIKFSSIMKAFGLAWIVWAGTLIVGLVILGFFLELFGLA